MDIIFIHILPVHLGIIYYIIIIDFRFLGCFRYRIDAPAAGVPTNFDKKKSR